MIPEGLSVERLATAIRTLIPRLASFTCRTAFDSIKNWLCGGLAALRRGVGLYIRVCVRREPPLRVVLQCEVSSLYARLACVRAARSFARGTAYGARYCSVPNACYIMATQRSGYHAQQHTSATPPEHSSLTPHLRTKVWAGVVSWFCGCAHRFPSLDVPGFPDLTLQCLSTTKRVVGRVRPSSRSFAHAYQSGPCLKRRFLVRWEALQCILPAVMWSIRNMAR